MQSIKKILNDKNYKLNPIGTGPYKLSEFLPGDKAIFVANKNYFQGPPDVQKIIIKPVPEATNRALGLEIGEYQISLDISPIDKKRLDKLPNTYTTSIESTRVSYLILNTKDSLLKDIKLREAISLAINKEDIVNYITEGFSVPTNNLIPKGFISRSQYVSKYNPVIAKKLSVLNILIKK